MSKLTDDILQSLIALIPGLSAFHLTEIYRSDIPRFAMIGNEAWHCKGRDDDPALAMPSATKDAIARLEYWRSQLQLSEEMAKGNELAMSDDEYDMLGGFLRIELT
jgi:hypothetical protein